MAIVKFTNISDIRGKIGGTIYQSGRSGIIMRKSFNHRQVSSHTQSLSQNYTQQCQYYWQTMTEPQRHAWNTLAVNFPVQQKNITGRAITGHELFIRYNYYRLRAGLSIFTSANPVLYPVLPYSCSPEYSLFTLYVRGNRAINPMGEKLLLFMSAPAVKSNNQFLNKLRLLDFTTVNSTIQTYTVNYLATFGNLYFPGDKIYFRYAVMSLIYPYITPFINSYAIIP